MSNIPEVPMPERIAALERDARGYPIPFTVMRDKDGQAVFTVNDSRQEKLCVENRLCHICGQALDAFPWFVGGPGSAYLNGKQGVYFNGSMHRDCLHYAMEVCPHLAGKMTKSVAGPAVEKLHAQGVKTHDPTMLDGTPAVFVAVQATLFRAQRAFATPSYTYYVAKPFRRTEFWQGGHMLAEHEGRSIVKEALKGIKERLAVPV